MKHQGQLFVVATPIGNLHDITQRAIDTLKVVDLIAAEDTRHSKKLLDHFEIKTKLVSLHAHNEQARATQLIKQLKEGLKVALICDAGTPLISDPGALITRLAHEAAIIITPIPGASALIAALSVSGLPAEQFAFEGFLAVKKAARIRQLEALSLQTKTWVIYESPHRILDLLDDMLDVLGEERLIVIGRELTKHFETIKAGPLSQIRSWLKAEANQQKGEFVLVVKGAELQSSEQLTPEGERVLDILLNELPVKQAVKLASKITSDHKNSLYQRALDIQKQGRV